MSVPIAEVAIEIATKVFGRPPMRARRFTIGTRHYVFEEFEDRPAVVVRMGGQPMAR
jgi:hypothetical protein